MSIKVYDSSGILKPNALSTDFGLEIAKGNVAGLSFIHKFGELPDIDTVDGLNDIWDIPQADLTYQTSAVAMEALSADANDTSAGTGAQVITVVGLDGSHDIVEQDVTMNGVTPVALTGTQLRIYRAFVKTAGSGDTNAGNINIRTVSGSVNQARIQAGFGQTQMAIYTVPNAKTGYLYAWDAGISSKTTGKHRFVLWQRPDGGAWRIQDTIGTHASGSSYGRKEFPYPLKFDAKTDLRIQGDTNANNSKLFASFDLLLVDD